MTEGAILAAGVACAWRTLAPDARRRAVAVVAAHVALTLGFLVLRTHVIGAVGQGAITALSARIALRAVPIYLWKYLCGDRGAARPRRRLRRACRSDARARRLAWLGVVAVAVVLWRARRTTVGPRSPSPPPGSRSRSCRCSTSCRCSPTTPIASPTCRRWAWRSPSPSGSAPPAAPAAWRSPAPPLSRSSTRSRCRSKRAPGATSSPVAPRRRRRARRRAGAVEPRHHAPARPRPRRGARPPGGGRAALRRRPGHVDAEGARPRRARPLRRGHRRRQGSLAADDTPEGRAILARITAARGSSLSRCRAG